MIEEAIEEGPVSTLQSSTQHKNKLNKVIEKKIQIENVVMKMK